jgi:dihydroneopterin aldolase
LDRIVLQGIEFRGHHGVSPEEKATGGHYSVDAILEADFQAAALSDSLKDTVDYGEIHRIILQIGTSERYHLLETLADRMATAILDIAGVKSLQLTVRKHRPPLPGIIDHTAVIVERRKSA